MGLPMPKNYYFILGVSPEADQNKIRKAYRSIAKKYHPDSGGSEANAQKFLEIKEAFDILSDNKKRRLYDKERLSQTPVHQPEKIFPSAFSDFDQDYLSYNFYDQRIPSLADLVPDDLFTDPFLKKTNILRRSHITIDISLSASEARTGGVFPLSIPIEEICPRCGARGHSRGFICHACQGHGRVISEQKISLKLPPNIRHGTQAEISLDSIGLKGMILFVVMQIDQ
jgi:molecular chaperone DnaJ